MDISAQKYKIWVNTAWLVFLSYKEYNPVKFTDSLHLILCDPDTREIHEQIQKLQQGKTNFSVIILSKNKLKLWKKLYDALPKIYAAGGLIQRTDEKYLFFYRRGSWDLPKGKLDKGETNRKAAVREVKEEVGLDCKISKQLPTTYHTYLEKKKIVLKETAWYKMDCLIAKVKLQYEEDIEKCKWVAKKQFKSIAKEIYPNLLAMLVASEFSK